MVEKPLGITVEECRESIEICWQGGVKLGVVFQERHQPTHVEAKRLVAAGEIGEVMLARVQLAWAVPGGRSDQRQDCWQPAKVVLLLLRRDQGEMAVL